MFIGIRLLILVVVAVIVLLVVAVLRFRRGKPPKKVCARCGASALHGYSQKAESALKDIVPLCLACLVAQLEQDYSSYRGHAVVVQPAAELLCYVFRDREYLQWLSLEAPELDHEVQDLLGQIGQCKQCGGVARCLWIESRGLNDKTFETVLKRGLAKALLAWGNPAPISLCGKCSVKQIAQTLRAEGFSYIEVCSPHGTDEGIVLPMGY